MTHVEDDPMSEATLGGKRPAPPPASGDGGPPRSGKLVVTLIVVWTIILLSVGLFFAKRLAKDPCWDHGTGEPLPSSCSQSH